MFSILVRKTSIPKVTNEQLKLPLNEAQRVKQSFIQKPQVPYTPQVYNKKMYNPMQINGRMKLSDIARQPDIARQQQLPVNNNIMEDPYEGLKQAISKKGE